MNRAEGIRKLGFRRWYERQLIEGHAYLVTCFLCVILVAACAKTFSFRAAGWEPLIMLALLMAGGFVCIASWRRYHLVIVRAEFTGEQSTCGECKTYGRFRVTEPAPGVPGTYNRDFDRGTDQTDSRLKVCCRQCGHEWMIE